MPPTVSIQAADLPSRCHVVYVSHGGVQVTVCAGLWLGPQTQYKHVCREKSLSGSSLGCPQCLRCRA